MTKDDVTWRHKRYEILDAYDILFGRRLSLIISVLGSISLLDDKSNDKSDTQELLWDYNINMNVTCSITENLLTYVHRLTKSLLFLLSSPQSRMISSLK